MGCVNALVCTHADDGLLCMLECGQLDCFAVDDIAKRIDYVSECLGAV